MKSLLTVCIVLASVICATAAEKPRIYVTDSKSWETSGGVGGTQDGFGGASKGGARPQTAEIIKTFGERCPGVIVNNKQEKADYVVLLDHEGGKEMLSRDNKVVVFNKDGDSIMSRSTRILGNAVKDACAAIAEDFAQAVDERKTRCSHPSRGQQEPIIGPRDVGRTETIGGTTTATTGTTMTGMTGKTAVTAGERKGARIIVNSPG
jgi:hypothetical protein